MQLLIKNKTAQQLNTSTEAHGEKEVDAVSENAKTVDKTVNLIEEECWLNVRFVCTKAHNIFF